MLLLDDSRWELLSHAYGSAEDIPAMLIDLKDGFENGAEIDLFYGYLCHQYTTYSATYAAVPHIVEIAFQTNQLLKNLIEIVDFCGTVHALRNWDNRFHINSDDQLLVSQLRQQIEVDYLKAIEKIAPLAENLLNQQDIENEDKLYLFYAFLAFENQEHLAQILLYNSPEEITFTCFNCKGEIYLCQENDKVIGYGEDYVFNKNAVKVKLISAELNFNNFNKQFSEEQKAEWLLYLAEKYDVKPLKYQIPYLFGEMICPHCERRIKILESIFKQYS